MVLSLNLKMSQKIDPREVLLYLNELGYTNISAQQLKEFIIDLKKIIKYEHRRRKHLEQVALDQNLIPSFDNESQQTNSYYHEDREKRISPSRSQKYNIFDMLHNLHTTSFKAKIVDKREEQQQHHIAVHIAQTKKKNVDHPHCTHINNLEVEPMVIPQSCESNKDITDSKKNTESTIESDKNIENKADGSKIQSEPEQTGGKSTRPNSKQSLTSSAHSTKFKKSKTQVLRSTSSTKSVSRKSDPVALYHQYQKEWKNIKFPGEDNHLDLRWAIREKLMDGPIVEVPVKKTCVKKKAF